MKKILSFLLFIVLITSYNESIATTSLTLSAVVWNSNHAPVVTLVDPDSDPRYLSHSTDDNLVKQTYTITFRDDETDDVDYTITTEDNWWSTTVSNWSIISTQYDSNNETYITFDYITPTEAVWDKSITITISDWPNVTVQTLNVYIY